MGYKKPFLPFFLTWRGMRLSGKERQIAEANYTLDGEDLDRRLLEIEFNGALTPVEEKEFKLKKLGLDLKYAKITLRDYDFASLEVTHRSKKSDEYKLAELQLKYDHNEIDQLDYHMQVLGIEHKDKKSQEYLIAVANLKRNLGEIDEREYSKEIATIRNEPWVEVVNAKINYQGDSDNAFEFELDWNQAFVEDLVRHGYVGSSQAEIVDQWFTQTCTDMFNTDPDFIIPEEQPSTNTTRRKNDGNSTEFS